MDLKARCKEANAYTFMFHGHWDRGSMGRDTDGGESWEERMFCWTCHKSNFIYPKNKIWIGPCHSESIELYHGFFAFFGLGQSIYSHRFIWDHKTEQWRSWFH